MGTLLFLLPDGEDIPAKTIFEKDVSFLTHLQLSYLPLLGIIMSYNLLTIIFPHYARSPDIKLIQSRAFFIIIFENLVS